MRLDFETASHAASEPGLRRSKLGMVFDFVLAPLVVAVIVGLAWHIVHQLAVAGTLFS